MPVEATWTQEMEFRVQFPAGETLTLASVPRDRRPGPGPSPMDAVQAAVAACTGMDVISILQKMRKTLSSLRIEVEATRREEHPRIFTDLVLIYHLDGPDLDEASVGRAVHLSQEKYCSVAAMLRPTVRLDYRIRMNGQLIDAPLTGTDSLDPAM
ncbi:MAG TPA: OsmC family protein [Candidatus Eisenbacteria bacterium]|nr:OsmC family protein [Candidatus Eisenbacteria bacterium]